MALDGAMLEHHAYRRTVLRELSTAMGFDAWVWPLSDPITTVGISPMAQVPCTDELPLLVRLKYATALNRWTELPRFPARAVSLVAATGGELSRSATWAGVLCRYAVTDVLSLVLADRWGTWGWLDLWKCHGGGVFTEDEARQLSVLAPAIATGLRHASAREVGDVVAVRPARSTRRR